jgi:hypothetical protein
MQDVRLPLMGVERGGSSEGSTVVLRGRGRGYVVGEAHQRGWADGSRRKREGDRVRQLLLLECGCNRVVMRRECCPVIRQGAAGVMAEEVPRGRGGTEDQVRDSRTKTNYSYWNTWRIEAETMRMGGSL